MAAPISSLSASSTMTSPAAGKPKDAADAAKQFEAMLIAQMLHSAREEAGDDALSGGDSAGSTMLDMADQQFSKLLADRGGLGLASVIAKSLKAGPAVAPPSGFSKATPEGKPTI
jgi:flagellar protein FlgJ